LYVNAVVKDQLLYFAMLNGMDKKAAFTEIKKLLEEFKIPGYLNKKVKTLSKGNKQKIQLISAILHKPQMVILDEPFSGLDPVNIELFKSTVLDLKKSGATILFSSHRMEDVEEMCDRIVMLNKGNVVENNTVQALINKYSREDVMNIVTSADITELIAESGLKLESRENMSFDVQFNDRNKLQHLYARILESGIELQGIRSRKTSLQEIFIKELADNE
jgi:ABC-2 type transport system ATP-binding protein